MCCFTVQIPYTERTETAFFCKRFNNQKDLQLRKPGGLEIMKRENPHCYFSSTKRCVVTMAVRWGNLTFSSLGKQLLQLFKVLIRVLTNL